jgi:hypothetical protein
MTAKGSEQRPERQYAVRLELRDETGAIVGLTDQSCHSTIEMR